MPLKLLLTSLGIVFFTTLVFGQDVRYLDPIFPEVTVTYDINYAQNIPYWYIFDDEIDPVDLHLDLYEPTGDTLSARPAVVVVHGGYFVEAFYNGRPYGSPRDSAIVNLCTRLARRGFTAVALEYRTGWNPLTPNLIDRREGFIRAFYRGLIDVRSGLRFLRKTIAEEGNPYHIDEERMVVWGTGSGAYLVNGAAFLDQFAEISTSPIFINPETLTPYLEESIHSDPYGLTATDQNMVNHPAYASDFAMAVSMGGAILDTNWIEGSTASTEEPLILGFHTVSNPIFHFAYPTYITGPVFPVDFPAYGTRLVLEIANEKGLNAPLDPLLVSPDALTTYATSLQDVPNPAVAPGQEATTLSTDHFYPFITPAYQEELEPWQWWDFEDLVEAVEIINQESGVIFAPDPLHEYGLQVHPGMSAEKGNLYLDTLLQFFIPRACVGLDLMPCATIVSHENAPPQAHQLEVFPNPARNEVRITASMPIVSMELYTSGGQRIRYLQKPLSKAIRLDRAGLPAGIYFLRLQLEDRTYQIRKVVWTP